jgi:hypothetical protein
MLVNPVAAYKADRFLLRIRRLFCWPTQNVPGRNYLPIAYSLRNLNYGRR